MYPIHQTNGVGNDNAIHLFAVHLALVKKRKGTKEQLIGTYMVFK
jgi:hypothetical protein